VSAVDLLHSLQMPTYAAYVWSTYGITAVGLAAIAWLARRRLAREQRDARRRRESAPQAQAERSSDVALH
jgi:heme exporter protein D